MDLAAGYKMTEVGIIPEDWDVSSLSDVGEINMCKRVMKYQTSEDGDIPFYKIGTFGKKADAFISKDLYEEYRRKYNYPQKGDILLSAAGTIGRTVVFDGKPSYFQDSNIVWIKNTETLVLNRLLFFIYDTVSWVTESGTIPRIYNGIVRSIKFAHPKSLEEQKKIGDSLQEIDSLISVLESQISKKKQIKEGTMQQLLTGKKRLPGFEGKWVDYNLKDIAEFKKGKGLSKEKLSPLGSNKCILYGEIFTTYNYVVNDVVSKTSCQEGTASVAGDILMPGSTTTKGIDLAKAVCVNEDNILLGGDIIIIRNIGYYHPLFLSYLITELKKKDIAEVAQGTTIIHLHASQVSELVVKIPKSIEEQIAIANILSDIDAEIQALEAQRDKYLLIKQGMMQNLLTGKTRLI